MTLTLEKVSEVKRIQEEWVTRGLTVAEIVRLEPRKMLVDRGATYYVTVYVKAYFPWWYRVRVVAKIPGRPDVVVGESNAEFIWPFETKMFKVYFTVPEDIPPGRYTWVVEVWSVAFGQNLVKVDVEELEVTVSTKPPTKPPKTPTGVALSQLAPPIAVGALVGAGLAIATTSK